MTHKKRKKAKRSSATASRKSPFIRFLLIFGTVILVTAATFGATLAYMKNESGTVTNTFAAAQMSCKVCEDFSDGIHKKNVQIQNTGDSAAYIRVKLLPYWYDKEGEGDVIVAKPAWTPLFTPGQGWVKGKDGFYYYTSPVAPGACTSSLIPELELQRDPVSFSRQVLEIIASCIQAYPADAVKTAWSGTNGSVTGVGDNTFLTVEQQTEEGQE